MQVDVGGLVPNRAIDAIEATMATLAEWTACIKREAMVYQADAKQEAAARLGVPYSTLRDMPHHEWARIRDNVG